MSQVLARPEVILEVIFEDGLLFLAIKNITNTPAYDVSIAFAKRLLGLDGTKEISALPLFRRITFLAPHKEIRIFLDTSASYFARRQPATINATVSFRDRSSVTFNHRFRHDLRIYKELSYVLRGKERLIDADAETANRRVNAS